VGELPALQHPLIGESIALRPFAERDIPEILIAYQDDPELHVRLGERRPPSGAELGRAAEGAESDRRCGRRLALTVVALGADVCVGQLVVHTVRWQERCAELALWVAPGVRRRGYGKQALGLAARWLGAVSELTSLQLRVDAENEAMLRTAAAAGAQPLGGPQHGVVTLLLSCSPGEDPD
jgi:ribosomal-protein-alanine N-acetyltransferase